MSQLQWAHKNQRYYQLQCRDHCEAGCSYCPGLGFLSQIPKTHFDLARSLKKAKSGQYSAVLLPCNLIYDSELSAKILEIKRHGLTPIVQINTRHLESHKEKIGEITDLGVAVNLIIGNNVAVREREARSIAEKSLFFYATIVIHNRIHGLEAFRALPAWLKKETYFYFPYQLKKKDEFFSVSSINDFIRRFRLQFPDMKIRPAPGIDIYDPRIEDDLDLEPALKPVYETFLSGNERLYEFSVVIPSYNSRNELLRSLHYLFEQDIGVENYEVIVVDDGSNDGTSQAVIDFVHGNDIAINFKLVYFPRFQERQMGDARFRAGVARNLGVKQATGRYLAFLDSDILVPHNYLSQLRKDHELSDLVQVQRLDLTQEALVDGVDVFQMDMSRFIYHPDNGYWDDFYKMGDRWNNLANAWKYTCSYGLSLRTDIFKQVGWFRKNYLYYGFEDTDLGYRVKKRGYRFRLSQLKVYHQPQRQERSEYSVSPTRRQAVLAKTAKIFFHNNLDPEIYQHLKVYMTPRLKESGSVLSPVFHPIIGPLFNPIKDLFGSR